jgi:hypothetical protein
LYDLLANSIFMSFVFNFDIIFSYSGGLSLWDESS